TIETVHGVKVKVDQETGEVELKLSDGGSISFGENGVITDARNVTFSYDDRTKFSNSEGGEADNLVRMRVRNGDRIVEIGMNNSTGSLSVLKFGDAPAIQFSSEEGVTWGSGENRVLVPPRKKTT
ncbi:MAG: hypothetical protein K2Z81_26340, partial [Cyanobacteria bacterium]|nr:hypothetical protein [Cyanobacteriota bacterium]